MSEDKVHHCKSDRHLCVHAAHHGAVGWSIVYLTHFVHCYIHVGAHCSCGVAEQNRGEQEIESAPTSRVTHRDDCMGWCDGCGPGNS